MTIFDNEATFARLLDCLYDAVMAPDGFQQFIQELAGSFDLKGIGLIVRHLQDRDSMAIWLHGIEPRWMESYALNYGREDMLALHLDQSPIGQFYATNLDLPAPERFGDTRFFREWAVPQGIAHAAGSVVMREGLWLTQIFLQRGNQQPLFTREEMARLNLLVPHLQRALQLRQRLGELRTQRNFLTAGLDAFAIPIVLFDEHCCIAHENRSARDLLDKGETLSRADGRVTTTSKASTRQLHVYLGNAVRTQRMPGCEPTSILSVERTARRPATLMTLPLQGGGTDSDHGGALMFVFDPDIVPAITTDFLQRLFGLTAAEGELAVALCAGASPTEIASERKRSISTVRNQIRSLYEKTGTNRQSDLVGLLLASPAYLVAKEHAATAN